MKQKPRCLCSQEQVSALHSHRIYSQLHVAANLWFCRIGRGCSNHSRNVFKLCTNSTLHRRTGHHIILVFKLHRLLVNFTRPLHPRSPLALHTCKPAFLRLTRFNMFNFLQTFSQMLHLGKMARCVLTCFVVATTCAGLYLSGFAWALGLTWEQNRRWNLGNIRSDWAGTLDLLRNSFPLRKKTQKQITKFVFCMVCRPEAKPPEEWLTSLQFSTIATSE